MSRDLPWIARLATIVAALLLFGGAEYMLRAGQPIAPKTPHPIYGSMMPIQDLRPDSDPPPRAELMYSAPPKIPVDVKTERKGNQFTIDLNAHGELFDFEKYVTGPDSFAVAQAAGEEYVPPIPILPSSINVGGPPWTWDGTLSSELSPQRAHATISVSTDKVAIGDGAVSTIRADVDIVIFAHDGFPATDRRLRFWFQRGNGLIKREFGSTSTREPVGP